jgi:3-oxoacyl-[acyl-carrier protein] reductase
MAVVLITGANRGIGLALVKAYAGRRDKVFACIRATSDRDALDAFAATAPKWVEVIEMDVSDPAEIGRVRRRLEAEPIDVLVNNAGILSNNKVAETTPEEWHKVLSINLDGAFYLSKLILPGMKARRWGRIVNTCSYAMKSGGVTAGTAYTVSKGALQALTFSLARECASAGVTVNGIAPAHVRTPMVTEQLTKEQQDRMVAMIPVGRFCEPEEFAHCVRFFVSPLAGFITGEILDLNGGLQFD